MIIIKILHIWLILYINCIKKFIRPKFLQLLFSIFYDIVELLNLLLFNFLPQIISLFYIIILQ